MGVYELIKDDDCAIADPSKDLLALEEGFASKQLEESGQRLARKGLKSSIDGDVPPVETSVGDSGCPPSPSAKTPRLVSLDVFRGITVAVRFLIRSHVFFFLFFNRLFYFKLVEAHCGNLALFNPFELILFDSL